MEILKRDFLKDIVRVLFRMQMPFGSSVYTDNSESIIGYANVQSYRNLLDSL